MTRKLAALIALAAVVTLTGCQADEGNSGDNASGGKATASAAKLTGKVLVTVNGEPITEAMLKQHIQQRTGGRGQVNADQRRSLLQELVDMTLMAQDAQDKGLADKPEVQARLESIRRAVLAQTMVQNMDLKNAVSEDEIKKAYEKKYQGGGEKEYHARHILVDSEDKAKDLIKQLENGADFAELAKKNSTGPTADKGGDLGWFSPDQMVPPFAEATEKLDKGEFTKEPVKTQFGWHVIKLEDVREAQPPSLDDVRSDLRNELARKKIEDKLDELRNNANVEYTDNAPKAAENSGNEGKPGAEPEDGSGGDDGGDK